MDSSNSQRPPPQNELQRRLKSDPPASAAAEARDSPPPGWRDARIAELAAAEAAEYANVETRSSRPEAIMRAGSRAASGAAHGLASASVGTARLTAAGLRGTLEAALFTIESVGRGTLRLLDAIGGAVISLLLGLGRGSLESLRGSRRALDVVDSAGAQASAASTEVASATGDAPPQALTRAGSASSSAQRTLVLGLVALAVAATAFAVYRSNAPPPLLEPPRATDEGDSRFQATLIALGAELHATLAELGLADPIPVAADKPEPPPHADDLSADSARMGHSPRATRHARSAHAGPEEAQAAEPLPAPDALDVPDAPFATTPVPTRAARAASAGPAPAPPHARPAQLVPGTDAPAAPF